MALFYENQTLKQKHPPPKNKNNNKKTHKPPEKDVQ